MGIPSAWHADASDDDDEIASPALVLVGKATTPAQSPSPAGPRPIATATSAQRSGAHTAMPAISPTGDLAATETRTPNEAGRNPNAGNNHQIACISGGRTAGRGTPQVARSAAAAAVVAGGTGGGSFAVVRVSVAGLQLDAIRSFFGTGEHGFMLEQLLAELERTEQMKDGKGNVWDSLNLRQALRQ
eukprot:CAMPEP_0206148178 /NCGR_PEP_ID=MMETSP1473-20131121/35826_1 /ASSEMBLY_ACC=CAM_ASM_001109 /TAXON_ID=1461547 /ORGANISM="Stichococcus sp, Strain RCC1054" /LENGTH=186 /DNA_ID=CAMNT_0053545425 /DNA_START=495 /DNA_END=1052 /DNA_ORIENTATION=+